MPSLEENDQSNVPMYKKISSRENLPLARVRRQRKEIDDIKHNNEIIRLEAIRGRREAQVNTNSGAASELARLQDQTERYLAKIEVEKGKIKELENQIKEAQILVLDQKQKMGGVNASKENDAMLSKQIRTLENRLDNSLTKFNEQLAENKKLREGIDHLRIDRVVFDGVYKRLERALHEKKKEMAVIIEDSKLACLARDKAKHELIAVKATAENEKIEFESEWKKLGEIMEADRKYREEKKKQLAAKTERQKKEAEDRKNRGEEQGVTADDMNAADSHKSDSVEMSHDKVQHYEKAYEEIKKRTGCEDMKDLVDKFLETEEKNFSLFNYVNELNNEIEQLEGTITETKLEIEKQKGQGMSSDTQQKRYMRVMEERLKRTKHKADEYEVKNLNAMKTINQLKTGIQGIFSRLGCNSTTIEEMLGNQGVTESNMMQYLGIIEQRAIEILENYASSQLKNEGLKSLKLDEPMRSNGQVKLDVRPPATEDLSDGENADSEEEERPLSRDELQKKSLRILNRKTIKKSVSKK